MHRKFTRRDLVKGSLLSGALASVAALFASTAAYGGAPALDPTEPTAKALGYVTKSTKPESRCGNCTQYQGNAADALGPCAIFPGKSVTSAGWCTAWAKKVAT
jgi:hypothetical protein